MMLQNKDYSFIGALLSIALGGFLFLCLVSYNEADLAFHSSLPNETPLNYGGILGARLAFGLLLLLGNAAFLLPFFFFYSGFLLHTQEPNLKLALRIASGVLFVAFASVLDGIFIASAAESQFDGLLASPVISRFLLHNLGAIGAGLLFTLLTLASFVFLTQLNPATALRILKLPVDAALYLISLSLYLYDYCTQKPQIRTRQTPAPRKTPEEAVAPDEIGEEPSGNLAGEEEEEEKAQTPPARRTPTAKPASPKPVSAAARAVAFSTSSVQSAEDYKFPDIHLLEDLPPAKNREIKEDLSLNSNILESTLRDFGIEAKVVGATKGPVITCYELHPSPGVKVQKIVGLSDDLALALKAMSIRILAPIPGKAAVGIEVPNSKVTLVYLRELLDSESFRKGTQRIPLVLGKDITGNPLISDLTEMPHLLIAGSTGSGKTVCVNAIISGILFMAHPDRIKFLMIDPKIVEMADYKDIPHLISPIVSDPKKAARALAWLVREMEKRYELLARARVRNIASFNDRDRSKTPPPPPVPEGQEEPEPLPDFLPYIVVIVDELADLMMAAPVEIETSIVRLAQMSRAVGIHLIIATQRPSVDVLTGIIKANFPARIAFKVASKVDSRTILDANGADKLLGKGDLLFLPPGSAKLIRAQGALVLDSEIHRVVEYLRSVRGPSYVSALSADSARGLGDEEDERMERDSMFDDAVRVVLNTGQASVSMIQRKLRIGYTRAARIMDQMEEEGIVGPPDPVTKTREILNDVLDS